MPIQLRKKRQSKRHLPMVFHQPYDVADMIKQPSKHDYDRAREFDHIPFVLRAQMINNYRRRMRHVPG